MDANGLVHISHDVYLGRPYRAHLAASPVDGDDGAVRSLSGMPHYELADAVAAVASVVPRAALYSGCPAAYVHTDGHIRLPVLHPV